MGTGAGRRARVPPTADTIVVFVENAAGSSAKRHFDEVTFEMLGVEQVDAAYPFPYGFVPGTLDPDGDAADCFVLTGRALRPGDTVSSEPVALLEQTEGGRIDHDVLAVLPGEHPPDPVEAADMIRRFVERFRAGVPGETAATGRLLRRGAALGYLKACRASLGPPPTLRQRLPGSPARRGAPEGPSATTGRDRSDE